jgi:hypothetical protein
LYDRRFVALEPRLEPFQERILMCCRNLKSITFIKHVLNALRQ